MDIFSRAIDPHRPVFARILSYARAHKESLYLVGGFVRDIYLHRSKKDPDIDFCMRKGAIAFGKGLARSLKCAFIVLDEAHGCCRLVTREGSVTYTIDIADFRAATLEKDLSLRDFSVNSVCIELSGLIECEDPASSVIDLYNGRADIKRKQLRILYKNAFKDDPLRILRAFSLAAVLGFKIHNESLALVRRTAGLLKDVSQERVRDELFKVLETGNAATWLGALDKHGILEVIFPEIRAMKRIRRAGKARIDVWQHTFDTVARLEELCCRLQRNADVAGYMAACVGGGRSVYALMKLAALLHDAGKPRTFRYAQGKVSFYGHERIGSRMVTDISRRLKLSNDEQRWMSRVTFMHLRPGYMATMAAVTPRAIFRFFRDAGIESVAILLLALADERATEGYEVVEKIRPRYERLIFRLVRLYFARQKASPARRLVTGHDIMRLGNMPPCASVGRILRELDEFQAVSKTVSRNKVLCYANKLIRKYNRGDSYGK